MPRRFRWLMLTLLGLALTTGARVAADPMPSDIPSASASTTLPAEIAIGEVAALTGDLAPFGTSSHNGILLGIDEVNRRELLGPEVRLGLFVADDGSTAAGAATAARELVEDHGVVALLGEVASKNSLAMVPVAEEYGLPMIAPSATNPEVTTSPWVFRACYLDEFQGRAIAQFARGSLRKSRGAILFDPTDTSSVLLRDVITAEYTALGGSIVATESYQYSDTRFQPQLEALFRGGASVIFLPEYSTASLLIMRAARAEGIQSPFIGGDGWDRPTLISQGGETVEGAFFATHFVETDPDPAVQGFVAAYRGRFSMAPDALAALGYDAVLLLADALKRAGTTDPAALRDALSATTNFRGITGTMSMGPNGDPIKGLVIVTIENGQRKLYERVEGEGSG